MTVFDGKLYQAARAAAAKVGGVAIPANAVLMRSFDGTTWSNWTPDTSKLIVSDPVMATFGGKLYQAAIQTGTAKSVITRSFDGTSWSAWSRETSKKAFGNVTMAEAFFINNVRLYQAIREYNALTPGVGKVWLRSTSDGATWTAWTYTGVAAKSDVTLKSLILNGHLRLYMAVNSGGKVKTRYTEDGVNWSAWVAEGATNGAVAMEGFDVTGNPGYERLYQAAPRVVPGTTTLRVWTRYTPSSEIASPQPDSAPNVVTIRKSGTGQGTVTAGEWVCGVTCQELRVPVMVGVTISVNPVPDANSTFVGWQNANGESLAGLEYVQAGETVIAVFDRK